MDVETLAATVARLAERLDRLEGARPATVGDPALVKRLLADLDQPGGSTGTVVYAGAGPWGDGSVAWQIGREWGDVVGAAGDGLARVLAALANGTRLRIVAELLRGPSATGDLAERLDQPSPGQLYHHLKELIAAGVVQQPERGTYAIRKQHVVPLLGVLSAAADLVEGDAR